MTVALPVTPASEAEIRLGLIGDNIAASRSPALHRLAGQLLGKRVSYDLLIPPALGLSLAEVLGGAMAAGLAGVNVTLPYKERVLDLIRPADATIARIGAVNTVRFTAGGPVGHNTDHSGFIASWRAAFGTAGPGRVALIGAGGVGRAIGFGLVTLAAAEILVIDKDAAKARALADALARGAGATRAVPATPADMSTVDGVVNATPLGMVGYPGSPVPDGALPRRGWAFDAVYTPIDTPFRAQALAAGLRFLSGWELFFHQGVDAFTLFTGLRPDLARLRAALGDAPPLPEG